ncbi:hypothetical protein ASE11_22745 [Hydrogenophaga sp. Root209]|nr:hypothetical protein ASE11_22745 [Hydrogenophaga sp. Root209]
MLYGALVQTRHRTGGGFDRLSPNGMGVGAGLIRVLTFRFGLSSPPFGLSLSKPSRGAAQP